MIALSFLSLLFFAFEEATATAMWEDREQLPGTSEDGSLTFRTCPIFASTVSWHSNNLVVACCDRLIYITVCTIAI